MIKYILEKVSIMMNYFRVKYISEKLSAIMHFRLKYILEKVSAIMHLWLNKF